MRNAGNDGYHHTRRYRNEPPEETSAGSRGRDAADNYERSIERSKRALANNDNEKSDKGERVQEKPQSQEQPDIIQQLDSGDWRKMGPDVMLRWLGENKDKLSPSERNEFFESLHEKMMKESEEMDKLNSEILDLKTEMLIDIGEVKATTESVDILDKQLQNVEHGAELQSDGPDKIDVRPEEVQIHQDLKNFIEIGDGQEDRVTVEIQSPLQSADQVSSEIASQLKDAGFDHVSTEIKPQTSGIETQFNKLESELDTPAFAPAEIEQRPLKKMELDTSELGNGEFG